MIAVERVERQAPSAKTAEIATGSEPDEAVHHGAQAEPPTRQPCRRTQSGEDREHPGSPGHPRREVVDDVPLGAGLAARFDHRRGRLPEWLDEERLGEQGEVLPLVHGGGRQNVVALRGRLGDVEIQGDGQVQFLHGVAQRGAVRNRQDRISGADEQRPDLPLTGCLDLLGHQGRRLAADHVAESTDAGAVSAIAAPQQGAETGDEPAFTRDSEAAEHRAARDVEVPCHEVDRVHEIGGEGSRAAGARSQPAVHGRSGYPDQIAGQLTDGLGRNPGLGLRALRREWSALPGQPVDAVGLAAQATAVDEILGEHHLQQRQQQQCVALRPDTQPFELCGGLGLARVDHHHPAAPLDDAVHAVLHPRCGDQAAMRDNGVGSHHHQQVRTGEIRDWHRQRIAVEQLAGHEPWVRVL